jgi:hypothetical protein
VAWTYVFPIASVTGNVARCADQQPETVVGVTALGVTLAPFTVSVGVPRVPS